MNVEIVQLLQLICSCIAFISSVVAVIVSAVKKKDVSKVVSYQSKFNNLLNKVMADGKLTAEEQVSLLAFFAEQISNEVSCDEVSNGK